MISEITEEDEEEFPCNTEAQKERIRQIIQYQKSLYFSSSSSSSSSSSAAASFSSFSSSRRSSSLLELMKGGSTSLRRLFDMEHTSLANHLENYSGSPIIKPILLWGSDTDDEIHDPWTSIKQMRHPPTYDDGDEEQTRFGLDRGKASTRNRKLTRKKSFRRLPGFGTWRCRGFKLRLRRLRVMICGRKF